MGILGIGGQPFIDLEPYIDPSPLFAIHEEICLGLTAVPLEYTGGSHKSMKIVPPSFAGDPYADYGQAIRGMSAEEFLIFVSLSDSPHLFDLERRHSYEFGEEREHPLSRRQIQYLKFRYGVYYPWKVYYELIPNHRWEEKSSSAGKHFTRDALIHFPRTVSFVKSLPFERIGSCKILGLEANDHGTIHRDADPAQKKGVDCFVTFCPKGDKRLFLWDEDLKIKVHADSRIYWFNDSDYHGVEPAPYFRYSVRVDGVFEKQFLATLRALR